MSFVISPVQRFFSGENISFQAQLFMEIKFHLPVRYLVTVDLIK